MHSCMHTFIHFSPHGPLSEHSSTHAPGACLLKRQLIDFDVQDHLGWTQQCSGKYLTINLLKKKKEKLLIVVFAAFSGINTPNMVNSKITVLCH